jgi:hypothetical protein
MKMGEEIDLGIKDVPYENALMPATMSEAKADEEAKTRYPHFHYEGEDELEIPEEGYARIKYKIVWKQEEETDKGEHYACKVEVQSIQPCGEEEEEEEEVEAPAKSGSAAADALDELMEAYVASKKEKGD